MTAYAYTAMTADGRLEQGEVEAGAADDVQRLLDKRGLIPVKIEERRRRSGLGDMFAPRIAPAQVTQLLADLSIMLNAGIRIDEALSIMEKGFDNGRLNGVVAKMRAEIAAGRAFSQALELYPNLFPSFQVAMVKVAESAGRLPTLLARIAEERQRFEKLSAHVGGAMRYPAVLLAGTIAVLIFFMVGVVPQFGPLLTQTSKRDPLLDTMIAISDFLRNEGTILLALLAAVILGGFLAFRQPAFREAVFGFITRLPGISEIANGYRTARFSRLLGIMVETGVTVPQAIRLISATIENTAKARGRAERASDALRQGNRLTQALEILELPPLAVRMLRIGEQSGELASLAYRVAEFYEARLERSLARLVGFVGPAAVGLISLLIGGMIVSIMSTLMSLNDLVR